MIRTGLLGAVAALLLVVAGCGEPPVSKDESMEGVFKGVEIKSAPSGRTTEMPKATKPSAKGAPEAPK